MLRLDWIWSERNQKPVLVIGIVLILAIALLDWATKPYISIGFLYLFPIILVAGIVPRWIIVFLGLSCAVLTEAFSYLDPSGRYVRFSFESLALVGCGLLSGRSRKSTISHHGGGETACFGRDQSCCNRNGR